MSIRVALILNGLLEDKDYVSSRLNHYEKVVAVDGGLHHCKTLGIRPDLIIGDLDSANEKILKDYEGVPTLRYPVQKYETDTELAITEVLKWQPKGATLFGGFGKRTDHLIYHLYLLQRYGPIVQMESKFERVFALKFQDVIPTFPGQTISLIPLTEKAISVTSKGLKWELNNATLDQHFMSISNVATGNEIIISFVGGSLICCLQNYPRTDILY